MLAIAWGGFVAIVLLNEPAVSPGIRVLEFFQVVVFLQRRLIFTQNLFCPNLTARLTQAKLQVQKP